MAARTKKNPGTPSSAQAAVLDPVDNSIDLGDLTSPEAELETSQTTTITVSQPEASPSGQDTTNGTWAYLSGKEMADRIDQMGIGTRLTDDDIAAGLEKLREIQHRDAERLAREGADKAQGRRRTNPIPAIRTAHTVEKMLADGWTILPGANVFTFESTVSDTLSVFAFIAVYDDLNPEAPGDGYCFGWIKTRDGRHYGGKCRTLLEHYKWIRPQLAEYIEGYEPDPVYTWPAK